MASSAILPLAWPAHTTANPDEPQHTTANHDNSNNPRLRGLGHGRCPTGSSHVTIPNYMFIKDPKAKARRQEHRRAEGFGWACLVHMAIGILSFCAIAAGNVPTLIKYVKGTDDAKTFSFTNSTVFVTVHALPWIDMSALPATIQRGTQKERTVTVSWTG
ncbi:hypothetical protein BDV96DRAFT_251443 [Lophiotrema nucula]|uniref:Uncharacterized protein n=1 Tax=Lophiotrema nucula TaxID=690887 RepID=A0A6A5YQV4_9PLEO|nr:hypothetical protein BDV96DRAFT_251443 [Lophiotrema nucula]